MHSGRDAGLGGMGFTPASQGGTHIVERNLTRLTAVVAVLFTRTPSCSSTCSSNRDGGSAGRGPGPARAAGRGLRLERATTARALAGRRARRGRADRARARPLAARPDARPGPGRGDAGAGALRDAAPHRPRDRALRPGLCSAWHGTDRTWRFRCRHSGAIATQLRRAALFPARRIRAADEHTLVISLQAPRPELPYLLTQVAAAPPGCPGRSG